MARANRGGRVPVALGAGLALSLAAMATATAGTLGDPTPPGGVPSAAATARSPISLPTISAATPPSSGATVEPLPLPSSAATSVTRVLTTGATGAAVSAAATGAGLGREDALLPQHHQSAATVTAAPGTSCGAPARGAIYAAPGSRKAVALTFDDGPGPDTAAVLEILARHRVRATFFMVGSMAATYPATVRQVVAAGHEVENHSWAHANFGRRDGATQRADLRRTSDLLARLSGRRPCFFRPPYGSMNSATVPAAAAERLTTTMWDVDTLDWAAGTRVNQRGYLGIRARARTTLPHPMVLLHDGGGQRPNMVHELDGIIDWYAGHGYVFIGLDGRTAEEASN